MEPNGKDKKRPYEPPRVYEMEVDMTQAMGASLCSNGTQASGACNAGNRAGSTCGNGNRATNRCSTGSTGSTGLPCTMGPTPSS